MPAPHRRSACRTRRSNRRSTRCRRSSRFPRSAPVRVAPSSSNARTAPASASRSNSMHLWPMAASTISPRPTRVCGGVRSTPRRSEAARSSLKSTPRPRLARRRSSAGSSASRRAKDPRRAHGRTASARRIRSLPDRACREPRCRLAGARSAARFVHRHSHCAALAHLRQFAAAGKLRRGRGRARRGDLPHAAVRRHADRHLDARDRRGADCDHRRRRQGRRLRHHISDLDRTVRSAVRRENARRTRARLRPRLPARAGARRARRQGRARRSSASGSSAAAFARAARRRRIRAQHPPAQRPHRSRRGDPPRADELRGRGRASACDGGRACGPWHRADARRRLCAAAAPNAGYAHAQLSRRRRRHPDVFVCRPLRLRVEGRQGFLQAQFRRQDRVDRHGAGRRRPQDHVQTIRDAPEGARAERCALPIPVASQKFARDSIAGVYIHATAVNNLVRNDGLTEFGRIGAAIASFVLAVLAAAAALAFSPAAAAAATVGLGVTWTAGATVALRYALALPLIEPLIASLAALVATIGYRFVIADRGKRLLRQSFALYLAPAVIEKMLSSNKPPALGGEMRNVTIYFSDIADFSSIAEKIPPTELVAAMNEYLSAMTDLIEAHGGFVDKYFGDAIVAVFGAPLDDKDHATNAVHAALRCAAALATLDRVNAAFGGAVRQRIGLNSGEALVGNIGSRRRFNYTVMGDVVNLASRLEGSNKLYGTTVIASEATVTQTGRTFVWRELDAIRVKGRRQAVRIFEPLGVAGEVAPELLSRAQTYGAGLTRYRARDFAGAAEKFALVANDDTPSALFLERVRQLAQQPPGADWEAVSAQEEK